MRLAFACLRPTFLIYAIMLLLLLLLFVDVISMRRSGWHSAQDIEMIIGVATVYLKHDREMTFVICIYTHIVYIILLLLLRLILQLFWV